MLNTVFYAEIEIICKFSLFIKGSKDRLLEIYRLLRSEPVIQRNNFTKDSTFMPKLLGLLCFYNSTPLKGTKYIESLSSDKKYKLSDLLPQSDPEFAPSTIKEIAAEINSGTKTIRDVTIRAWVRTNRDSGKIGFISAYDGSTLNGIQVVYKKESTNGFEQANLTPNFLPA